MTDKLNFLDSGTIAKITQNWGSPVFVYSEKTLKQQAAKALNISAPYGLTVRYAMKANPNRAIINIFDKFGIQIDASSGFEAERAMLYGIKPQNISITAQEMPKNLKNLIEKGVLFNACSMSQLEVFGKQLTGNEVGIRINPGLGSGHSNRTNVGGPSSSFGIWHEYITQAKEIASKYNLKITRLHTHIGSGSDPGVWLKVAKMSIELVNHFPDVTAIDLGGGFKVARMANEKNTDIEAVGQLISEELVNFYNKTGRKLKLEIEPGTFLVANAGSLISSVIDIIDTGKDGYEFIKINSGMTEILRPSIYGAQHPLLVVNNSSVLKNYVVVGHCCESGDILTPKPGDPEGIATRQLHSTEIGDTLVVEGVGAYCSSMSAQNYNSFPAANQVLIKESGDLQQIARAQTLDEIISLEDC